MAKKKYYVDFSLEIATGRIIAAESEEKAVEIARDMLFEDDGFRESLFESMDNDWDQWRPKYIEVDTFGQAPDDAIADNEEE